jgi:hypothetical protein
MPHITDPEGLVKRYLKDFMEIKDKKVKEAQDDLYGVDVPKGNDRYDIDKYKTFKEVETLVDYVAGKRPVGSANFEEIEVDGKPVFVNDEVEVYYADTPRACIEYKGNKPYSWCVSRSTVDNMFYNYRLGGYDPAFYFVKRIKPTKKEFSLWSIGNLVFNGTWKDPYHFFVVQVQKDVEIGDTYSEYYIVTSANNEGDVPMSWNEIVENAPELKGLQEVFQPKPLTEKEREKIEKYKNGLTDEEFDKLPYKEKDFYMAVYVKMNKPLTDGQFNVLPEDLKNKYIGFGVGLSDEQFEMIKNNKNLVKRYAEISRRKYETFLNADEETKSNFEFKNSEFKFIDLFKDIEKFKQLDGRYYKSFLESNSNRDEMARMIIDIKGDTLDSDGIGYLLEYSSNPDEIAKKIIDLKGDLLDWQGLETLLSYSKNSIKILRVILKVMGDNLDSTAIMVITDYLLFSHELMKEFIFSYKNILKSSQIASLLAAAYSPENYGVVSPEDIIEYIIYAKKYDLTIKNIVTFMGYTKDKNKLFDKLIEQGISRDKINQAIIEYKNYLSKNKLLD